jgi:DNA repair protein RadC
MSTQQQTEARDRIQAAGIGAVSDADLLAALGAAPLAGEPLTELAWQTPAELERRGIGATRAAHLAAAFELGRRGAWNVPRKGDRILDPQKVADLMRPIAFADKEEFHVIMLDVRGRLIRSERTAQGSLTQCPVSPRECFRPVVRENAHGVIFVHNHPSGDPSPSTEDEYLTGRLIAGAELLGITARDHVIVAATGYFSFVEAGRFRK